MKFRSLTVTRELTIMTKATIPRKGIPSWKVHPGEILREEFLKPTGLSAYALAKRVRVPPPYINHIVLEPRELRRTRVCLSKVFGTTGRFWLNLQDPYDVSKVRSERADELKLIRPFDRSVTSGVRFLLRPRPARHHDRRNPSSRTEVTLYFRPFGLCPAHHVLQNLVDNVLLENSQVTVALQVFL
jgi:antitoxin HigA-1